MKDITERLSELEPSMTIGKDCRDAREEIERLRAELEDARRTADFWIGEHLVCNAELDALKQQEPVAWIEHSFGGVSYGYYPNARNLPEEVKFDLYTHPVPSVPVRLTPDGKYGQQHHYACGWNDAIDFMLEEKEES